MSFISTGVEYGLHCLLYLAEESPAGVKSASVRDLADLQGVSVDYLAKLFTKLAKGGIVVATEGIRGGFSLARPADGISVNDVVIAIDGDKRLFDCREIRGGCAVFGGECPAWAQRGVCGINSVMIGAEKSMREELSRHTLADLAVKTMAKAPASFGPHVVEWLNDRALNRRGDGEAPVRG